jgi:hypothetical protein
MTTDTDEMFPKTNETFVETKETFVENLSLFSTNGASPASPPVRPPETVVVPPLPRAVRRLRSLSCETPAGMQRFTKPHLARVERFRRHLSPRGRQAFAHLTLVDWAVLLNAVGNFLTEPEV